MTRTMNAIEITGLRKTYRASGNAPPKEALKGIDLTIPAGSIFGLLGPNGAGKSTTMRMLAGFIAPTRGTARIADVDVERNRLAVAARIGYLPESGPLYDDMTPLSLLRFLGAARGMNRTVREQRIDAVVEQCQLGRVLEKPISKLSKGYRQRVGMAQALLHSPDVMILDEPTAGLDPNQIDQVRRLIRDLRATSTILLSTHILQEVEAVADRVIFIHRGRLVFDGSLDSFRAGGASLEERFRALTAA
ncbi:MAG: ABC transporter ATP-binding protein [Phycisphaerales bacterium]|nr:ABC transporter ATP-binding protein [Phycisphaerales bacterium]